MAGGRAGHPWKEAVRTFQLRLNSKGQRHRAPNHKGFLAGCNEVLDGTEQEKNVETVGRRS